jgi:hypothetical protein
MKMIENLSRCARIAKHLMWGALVICFLVVGVPRVAHEMTVGKLGPMDHLCSMDHYLWGTNSARNILKFTTQLPEDGRGLIFVRGNDRSLFNGLAIAYLSWPRPIEMVFGDEAMAAQRLAIVRQGSVSFVAFCKIDPPDGMIGAFHCGEDVQLVSLDKSRQ